MQLPPMRFVVEGATDVPVVLALLRATHWSPGQGYPMGGKDRLDHRLARYNMAARHSPWLVLRDMDRDAPCPGDLVAQLMPQSAPWLVFRLAVRSSEAWLLGDAEALAGLLRVRASLVPACPEALADPKQAMVDLARRSHSSAIREQIVPRPLATAKVGPGYARIVADFAHSHWRPRVAAQVCPSLRRCLAALERLREQVESA